MVPESLIIVGLNPQSTGIKIVVATPDVTSTDFYNLMQMPTVTFTNHAYSSATPAATFTEASGALDTAFVVWSGGYPSKVYIYDFGVAIVG